MSGGNDRVFLMMTTVLWGQVSRRCNGNGRNMTVIAGWNGTHVNHTTGHRRRENVQFALTLLFFWGGRNSTDGPTDRFFVVRVYTTEYYIQGASLRGRHTPLATYSGSKNSVTRTKRRSMLDRKFKLAT